MVFGDAFNDCAVPFHLTTLEFDRLVDRALRDDGPDLVNIIDGGGTGISCALLRAPCSGSLRMSR